MKEWLSGIMSPTSQRGFRQGFISLLFLSLTIAVSSNSQSFAEEGTVYPDTARLDFDWSVNSDTIIITLLNQSTEQVTDLFISDFTDSLPITISCLIDGIVSDSLPMDNEYGSVYPDKYATRWIVGDFSDSLIFRYYSPIYNSFYLNISAGHPFPIFGIMPNIGPPGNISWQQNPP